MTDDDYRLLPVRKGRVPCLPGQEETVEHCRFCVHARYFEEGGRFVKSPGLAYCLRHRTTEKVDVSKVTAVKCADRQGEGYRSMMNIIG